MPAIAFKKSEYFLTKGYSDNKITQAYHLIIELLNRVKLDRKRTFRKRIVFSLILATAVILLAVYFSIN